MKNTQVSTKIHTIDFKKIMANALKRERWGDKWTLFDGYGVRLVMRVSNINIDNNSIGLHVRMDHQEYDDSYTIKLSDTYNSTTYSISMSPDHYNHIALINGLVGVVTRLVESGYREFAQQTPEYDDAKRLDQYHSKVAHDAAVDYLDELEIEDDEIREAYINDKVDDATTYEARLNYQNNYRIDHRDSLKNLITSSLKFAE